MLARIVRDTDTQQLTWQRITGDAGTAGATPLGSVLAYFGTTVPEGFLPCNGATYDVTQYPELYAFLNSSTLPDLRECALVGIGENSTDTLGTHDIFTLGQFKDFATAGFSSAKTAGYTISGNSVILNSTVNASNRKLVTQYVADADATDLQNLQTSSDTVTRTRSKGVNWIIKAIPGMETTDVTDAIEAINEKLAKALVTKDVLTLPTGAGIEGYIYHYQGHYYVPHIDEESPTQSYLTELANLSDIQPVIEWLASADPLPTGSAIKEHLYAQEYTTAGGDTKYNYYIGKVDSSDPLNNELVALETGAGASIFVGTQAEWDALTTAEKNEYQQANLTDVNSVVHVPVDVVADGNMNPVTSNAVFDSLYLKGASATEILNVLRDTPVVGGTPYDYTTTATILTDGWYKFQVLANMKDTSGVLSNYVKFSIGTVEVVTVSTFNPEWNEKVNTVIIPVKAGTVVTYHAHCDAYAAGTNLTYRNFGSVYKIA